MNTEECDILDMSCRAEESATELVGTVATSALEQLAAEVAAALDVGMSLVATMWTQVPTPSLVTDAGARSTEVAFVQDSLGLWTLSLAVLSILVGAGRMAWEQRADPGRDLLRSILTFVLVISLSLAVIDGLIRAMDLLAEWIIVRSTSGTTFAVNIGSLFVTTNTEAIGVLLFVIMGGFALVGALVQVVLMIVRGGMLVLLAGVLPTTAAFTNTRTGQQWFDRSVGWLIAFILYKPVAAIIYALAFRLAGDPAGPIEPTGSIDFLSGLTLMALALIAMPALMRFCTPLVSAVASGSGGSSGAMVGAAAVTAANGAVHAGRAMSSSSGSPGSGGGGGGAPGPNGATGTGSSGPGGGGGPTGAPGSTGAPGAAAAGGSTASTAAATGAAAGTAGTAAAAATGPPGWAALAAGAAVSGAQQGAAAIQRGAQSAAESGETPDGSR